MEKSKKKMNLKNIKIYFLLAVILGFLIFEVSNNNGLRARLSELSNEYKTCSKQLNNSQEENFILKEQMSGCDFNCSSILAKLKVENTNLLSAKNTLGSDLKVLQENNTKLQYQVDNYKKMMNFVDEYNPTETNVKYLSNGAVMVSKNPDGTDLVSMYIQPKDYQGNLVVSNGYLKVTIYNPTLNRDYATFNWKVDELDYSSAGLIKNFNYDFSEKYPYEYAKIVVKFEVPEENSDNFFYDIFEIYVG